MLGISFLAKLVILHIILGMVGQVFMVVGVVGYLITADIMHILGMAGQVFRVVGVVGHFIAGQVFITAGFGGVLVSKVIYRVFNLIWVLWDIMVVFMVIFCGWGV